MSSKTYTRRYYRLNYKINTPQSKKKMFVYTPYGKKLIKKQLPDEFDFPYVSSICIKEKPSNLTRNILITLAVVFILLLGIVYRRYHLRINVSYV